MSRARALPLLLVTVVGCSGDRPAEHAASDEPTQPDPAFCASHDPCGAARPVGTQCAAIYDLCTRAYVTCACVPGAECAGGVCAAVSQAETEQEQNVVGDDPDDPYEQVPYDRPHTCDPRNPCRGPAPENGRCGTVSAGCPGVTVSCSCAAGLACVDGTCRRPTGPGSGGGGPCNADAQHCCMPDGRLVRPGGCQPSYPPNVQPATRRNPDGTCREIECYLRCLPETARIDTPDGPRSVTTLSVGDRVFTRDEIGARIVAPVLLVRSLEVASVHSIVELSLADGRVVRASAGHPLARGTSSFGDLRTGDHVDGAEVVGVRTLPYTGSRTWDLLPAGPTGAYWADGVLVGSTLRSP